MTIYFWVNLQAEILTRKDVILTPKYIALILFIELYKFK